APIVSIITDKDNLFDDDIGIYTVGNHYNYGQHGKEWERQVHLEIFDNNTQVIDQNAGIRIHGRGSRVEDQKSFRIYARKKYGQESFSYQFFKQKHFNSFKTLIISAEKTYTPLSFKDEICTSIISDIGLDYQAWQMVIVFINGEYWGIHHIREYQKEEYFYNNYSYKNDSFDLITHNRGEGPVADLGDNDAYQSLISFIELNDIRLEENYDYVTSMLDIDNMIDYYIAQIYFANFDFPDNNYRMWRSRLNESKWRWLFYDCEACMHFVQMNSLNKYINPNAQDNFEEIWDVFLLNKLLVNDTFKAKFYTKFRYHLENTFNTGRVLGQISAFKDVYEPYIFEHIYRWNKPNSIRKWEENIHTLEQFALQRPLILEEQLEEIFINPFITYPNPTSNIVNIKLFSNHPDVKVKFYSINGSLVYENNFYNNEEISFRPNVDSGMYLLQVYIQNRIYTDKILFQ
ncbi:MAG: CotH kinase family protein, partial [Bacteroidales bacterium]|nr:CotH kinase family protein [Bacteroidales bacterium]